MPPQLIFGTASFGMDMTDFQDPPSLFALYKTLQELGIRKLDSGARYPPLNPGRAESLIGETKEMNKEFLIDTKVFTDVRTDGSGDLKGEAIESSIQGSLQRLKAAKGVNILHAHRADPSTPLDKQIQEFNRQIELGRCEAWGVSNIAPQMLEEMILLCEKMGLRKPVCYQGDYNLITRGMETELLPLLRSHGIAFNAFRPLAAGFLTGKLVNNEHGGTRFDDSNPLGKGAQKLFGGEQVHSAMRKFDVQVRLQNITPMEAAIRWIAYNSALGNGDGIILGASKTEQIRETVMMMRKGPLPAEVLEAADDLWSNVGGIRGEIV